MLNVIKTLTRKNKEPLSYIVNGIADGLEKHKLQSDSNKFSADRNRLDVCGYSVLLGNVWLLKWTDRIHNTNQYHYHFYCQPSGVYQLVVLGYFAVIQLFARPGISIEL